MDIYERYLFQVEQGTFDDIQSYQNPFTIYIIDYKYTDYSGENHSGQHAKIVFDNGQYVTITDLNTGSSFTFDNTTLEPELEFIYEKVVGGTGWTSSDYLYVAFLSFVTPKTANLTAILYQMTGDKEIVNKTLYLDVIGGFNYVMKEETSLLNPSILITFNKLPNFNYVYLTDLQRFYYVTDITFVRNNLWRINLKVDVLFSYSADIYEQECYILRNQNSRNGKIVDERMPFEDVYTLSYLDCDSIGLPTGITSVKNTTFNVSDFTGKNFIVNVCSQNYATTDVDKPTGTDLKDIGSYNSGSISYVGELNDVFEIQVSFFIDDNASSFANSIIALPFDISSFNVSTNAIPFAIPDGASVKYLDTTDLTYKSSTTDTLDLKYIPSSGIDYLVVADFLYVPSTSYDEYAYYEPKTIYELYVPFVGWIPIYARDLINKRVLVYYGLDVTSGFATAFVRNETDDVLVYSGPCQLGVKLPINKSNNAELTAQKQNNTLNMTLGLISSGVSMGIGAVSGNPIGLIGGILSGANTIKSYVNANNLMFERGQTSASSTESAFYTPQDKVILKIASHEPVDSNNFTNTSEYGKLTGYPVNEYGGLSSYSGYTEIGDIHYVPTYQKFITSPEIDEIISLARRGIIL